MYGGSFRAHSRIQGTFVDLENAHVSQAFVVSGEGCTYKDGDNGSDGDCDKVGHASSTSFSRLGRAIEALFKVVA